MGESEAFCRAFAALTLLGPVPAAPAGAPCDPIAAWKPNVGLSETPRQIVGGSIREGWVIIVGIDAHSRAHVAAAIDEQGRLLGSIEVAAGPVGLEQLCEWLARFERPRLVAVENARGYG